MRGCKVFLKFSNLVEELAATRLSGGGGEGEDVEHFRQVFVL